MKTIDLSLFNNEKLIIKSLSKKEYKIRKNISVGLCIDILKAVENLNQYSRDSEEYCEILENLTWEIISKNHAGFSKEDFDLLEAQESLFLVMYSELIEISNQPVLQMPDVKIKQENKYVFESDEVEMMEGITYIMSKTSNNFTEIMNMPYACYLAILKHLRLADYMQNEEYREDYYKLKRKKSRDKNKNIKQKIDLKGLKNFNL